MHCKFSDTSEDRQEMDFQERQNLANHMRDLHGIYCRVKVKLSEAYQQSAQRYNLRRRPLSLTIGQIVWKKNYTLSDGPHYYAAKLAPRFIKCRVTKKISTNVYQLEDMETGRSLGN